MVGGKNIKIRKADSTFPNFVPSVSPSSILRWISLLIGIETKQSSAQLIIKLPEQTFQTWLDWKLECRSIYIVMNSEIIPFLSNNRLLVDNSVMHTWRIFSGRIFIFCLPQMLMTPLPSSGQISKFLSTWRYIIVGERVLAWRPIVQLFFLLKQLIGPAVQRYI